MFDPFLTNQYILIKLEEINKHSNDNNNAQIENIDLVYNKDGI